MTTSPSLAGEFHGRGFLGVLHGFGGWFGLRLRRFFSLFGLFVSVNGAALYAAGLRLLGWGDETEPSSGR
jgi:hypothetical protein